MKNYYRSLNKELKGFIILLIVFIVFPGNVFSAGLPKTVWGYVHNSDGSTPSVCDITITAYLQKNPTNTTTLYNTGDGSLWQIDIAATWQWFPAGGGGINNANGGDVIVVEFLNTGSGPFAGESGSLSGALDAVIENQQLGSNDFALPVELSSFNAHYKDRIVFLHWVTESEIKNLGFNIYKSIDDINDFEKINTTIIQGAGTTSQQQIYTYEDKFVESGHTYFYKLVSVDFEGKVNSFTPVAVSTTDNAALPGRHELTQNFPNPFNPSTTIKYILTNDTNVQLTVYNMLGDFITQLVNEDQSSGLYSINWNASDDKGTLVSAGIYFYELQTDETTLVRKMIYTK